MRNVENIGKKKLPLSSLYLVTCKDKVDVIRDIFDRVRWNARQIGLDNPTQTSFLLARPLYSSKSTTILTLIILIIN